MTKYCCYECLYMHALSYVIFYFTNSLNCIKNFEIHALSNLRYKFSN